MIKLDCNFNNEELLPETYEDFYKMMAPCLTNLWSSSKFENWFKIYWDKIVPISTNSIEFFRNNTLKFEYISLSEIFEKIKLWKDFFIAISYAFNTTNFCIFTDDNINDIEKTLVLINNEIEKNKWNFCQRLLALLQKKVDKNEIINDPYIIKIILDYMQSINSDVSEIVSITDKWSYFHISYEHNVNSQELEEPSYKRTDIWITKDQLNM